MPSVSGKSFSRLRGMSGILGKELQSAHFFQLSHMQTSACILCFPKIQKCVPHHSPLGSKKCGLHLKTKKERFGGSNRSLQPGGESMSAGRKLDWVVYMSVSSLKWQSSWMGVGDFSMGWKTCLQSWISTPKHVHQEFEESKYLLGGCTFIHKQIYL